MTNQFFYTRKESVVSETEETSKFKEFRDSFNIEKVLRSVSLEDGRVLILLNDIHERVQEVPDVDIKTNKIKGYKRERNTFQSEIYLSEEEGNKFYELSKIN
jgi:hypothetical protein